MGEYDFIKSPCVIGTRTSKGVEVTFYKQSRKITALILAGAYVGDTSVPKEFKAAIDQMLVEFNESIVTHNFFSYLLWVEDTLAFKRMEAYFVELIKDLKSTKKVFDNKEKFEEWLDENHGIEFLIASVADSELNQVYNEYSNCSSLLSSILNCGYDKYGNHTVNATLIEYIQLSQIEDDRKFDSYADVKDFMMAVPDDISDNVVESYVCCAIFKQFER